jgi:hypothetical protein
LVHFLALGGLIFAANAILHPSTGADPHRIEIGRADIDRIRALYAQQWGAAPEAADMPNLVDNYVRSEILFREGASLGLAADDSVLRNRVMQKMEFLLQDSTAVQSPSDAEMERYLEAHAATYRVPEQIAFTQIYFSSSRRGDRAEADARAVLASLGPAPPTELVARGDPFMLPANFAPQSRADLERDFGAEFAAAAFALPVGSWQGPVRSVFGLHLVRVEAHEQSRLPPLSEVRDRVHDDLTAERFRQANDAAYAKIRSRYRVVLSTDALAEPMPAAEASGGAK